MASKRRLRAVSPVPEGRAPLTIAEAAESGSTRDVLVAMVRRIAKAADAESTPARDLAALTKRLADLLRDVDELDARSEVCAVPEVDDGEFDASAV